MPATRAFLLPSRKRALRSPSSMRMASVICSTVVTGTFSSAQNGHVGALGVADGLGNGVGVAVHHLDVVADGLAVDDAAVDHQHTAGLDVILELIQGGTVHGHDHVGLVHQGGGHGLVGHDDGAVGGTAAHLGAVGGQPGDVLAVQHAGHRHELTDQEHALTAETGENKGLFHVTWPPCLCKHPEDSKESCFPPARSLPPRETYPSWWGRWTEPLPCRSPCPPSGNGKPWQWPSWP